MAPKKKRPQGTPQSVSETLSSRGGKPVSNAEERRAKRAEAVAAMKREQARRQLRSRLLAAGGIIVAVAIIAVAVIAVGLGHKHKAAATTAASDTVVSGVTSIPTATFDTVGVGDLKTFPGPIKADPLTADGKPRVLYVGAEYCPYCAAERWAMAAALARFGTFSGLGQTASTPTDVFPNTPTLTFHGSTYTSKYLSFTAYETETNTGKPLDTLTSADQALFTKYDAAPYVDASSAGSIPFIDLVGSYISSGASYSPEILKGMTHAEVATAMQDPTTTVAKSVDATANVFSAIICQATNGQPANVCSSAGVKAAAAKLPAS